MTLSIGTGLLISP